MVNDREEIGGNGKIHREKEPQAALLLFSAPSNFSPDFKR
jgi:hypothetical protein